MNEIALGEREWMRSGPRSLKTPVLNGQVEEDETKEQLDKSQESAGESWRGREGIFQDEDVISSVQC